MADVVDPKTRSRMMSRIKGKNTKPEILIRSGLHRLGYRYRLHDKNLAGKPDMVFPRYRAVIFVHGCFWHGHDCHLFKWPSTRSEWWREKIERNRSRDAEVNASLRVKGWRQACVWECAIKGKGRYDIDSVIGKLANWLETGTGELEIKGKSV